MIFVGSIYCRTCQIQLAKYEAPTLCELGDVITAALIAWHSTPPHKGPLGPMEPGTHVLEIALGSFVGEHEGKRLTLWCERCGERTKIERESVPMGLVAAYTICYHSLHEGHPLHVTWGDRIIVEGSGTK